MTIKKKAARDQDELALTKQLLAVLEGQPVEAAIAVLASVPLATIEVKALDRKSAVAMVDAVAQELRTEIRGDN